MQFSAAVTGTGNAAVTWSAAGGSIDGNGRYTAGSTAGVFTVAATSVADPTVAGTAFVQITTANVSGTYEGQWCYVAGGLESGSVPICRPTTILYRCDFLSVAGGLACGWFQDFEEGLPWQTCRFETTGTDLGGPFTGRITRCQLNPASVFSFVRAQGTIGAGELDMTIFYGSSIFIYELVKR